MNKDEHYLEISKNVVACVGGMANIQGSAHCATRLRVILENNDLVQIEKLETIDLVKGVFVAGDQLQIIFGPGLVNDIYAIFAKYTNTENMSLGDIKAKSTQKQNPIQKVIKSLSDVFVEIMPAILAAALLMGLTGVLGKWDVVLNHETLYGINRLANLASVGIFAILPLAVCYSATKRYGGRPILGLVVGAIMLDSSLANAYSIGSVGFNPEVLNIMGLHVSMVGFQGGVIIALMMGYVVASLDKYLTKKIPDVIKLLVSPMLTVFISTVLLFTVVGPMGRALGDGITGSLLWMTNNLGALGYMIFAGLQQIIVITGLHHILGAVEAQLIADAGRNFINPLMSVALIGQAGAVLGYLALNWKNVRTRELCIPSFISTLFGISEPAIFGINLRYKFPLIAGCVGGAIAGAYVYFVDLASLGFGTTAVPGIAIVDPANNGYINYIIAHVIGLAIGFILTLIFGKALAKKNSTETSSEAICEMKRVATHEVIQFKMPMQGKVEGIEACEDAMFAAKTLGEGIVIHPTLGEVRAPADARVEFVFPSHHAIGLSFKDGSKVLIHCGINTVELKGEGFVPHVEAGQQVIQGDLLLNMDLDFIKSKGYPTQTMMVFSELAQDRTVVIEQRNEEELKVFLR